MGAPHRGQGGLTLLLLALAAAPCGAQTLRPPDAQGANPNVEAAIADLPAESGGTSTKHAPLDQLTWPISDNISIRDIVLHPGKAENKTAAATLPALTADIVRDLRDDPGFVQAKLATLGKDLALVTAAAKGGSREAQGVLLSAVALDGGSSTTLLDSLKLASPDAEPKVRDDLREIRRILGTFTGDVLVGALFAQGSVKGAVSGGSDAAAAGTGSVGLRASRKGWSISGLVTVASSIDTLRDGFGSFLLTPASGKSSLSTMLIDFNTPHLGEIVPRLPYRFLWPALHVYLAGANSTWEARFISGEPAETTFQHRPAAVLGLGTLLNWRLFRGRILDTPVQMNVETGYAHRWLKGDVFSDTTFVRAALGVSADTVSMAWGAWESGFQMSVGAVTAGVQYYWINGHDNRKFVSGLTNGQLVIAIAVSGEVVKGVLSQ